MLEIKKKYKYSHVHDTTTLTIILQLLAAADTAHMMKDAPMWYPVQYQRSLMRLQLKQATKDKLEGEEVDGLK